MTRRRRILRNLLGLAFAVALAIGLWLFATRARVAQLPPLKDGDIVFQTSHALQSLAIAMASRSPYSHMGLIEIGTDGLPYVVEASTTVRSVPLQSWINRGVGGRLTVKRVKDLSPEAAKAVLAAAHRYDGLPYDLNFTFGKDAMYCSEHVRLAFAEGAGLELGTIQKFASLAIDNFAVRHLVQQRWTTHPLCRPVAQATFAACYAHILDQPLVTPVSIARDARLTTIYSNFTPFGD